MQILADSMIAAMSRGTKGIMAAFEELSKDPRKAALFGPEFVKQFVEIEQGFKQQSNDIRVYGDLLKKYEKELEEALAKEEKLAEERKKSLIAPPVNLIGDLEEKQSDKLKKEVENYKRAIAEIPRDYIDRGRDLLLKGLDIAFDKGAKYIAQATGNAMQQAGINVARAQSLVLSGARAVEESTRLRVQEIDIQINAIKTNIDRVGKQARAAVQSVDTKLAAQNANLIVKESEKRSALIEGRIQKERAELADKNKIKTIENEINQILIARNGILQSIAGITTKEIITAESQVELSLLRNKQVIDLSAIELAIQQAGEAYNDTGLKKYKDDLS